ncbi:YihY/virulence factor BrkB family protein [Chakrabartyella piscis]|uniref:YihY/virulence factor BrkB family protein n=1 Tax=Chakrabartyella piscis TaxID=2918914 RepID=UPI002958C463|nr:YihY/virulence factor BrkB family protein [Chakrabartyella piscis]
MNVSYEYKGGNRFLKLIFALYKGYRGNEVSKTAAYLTYYMMFAIFPFLIFVSSVLGFLQLPQLPTEGYLVAAIPAEVLSLVNMTTEHMMENRSTSWLTFGAVFTLWFPYRATQHLLRAINGIYGYDTAKHHMIRSIFLAILLIVLFPILIFVLLMGKEFLEILSLFLPWLDAITPLWTTLRFLPIAFGLLLLVSAIYYFSPNERPPLRYVFSGALVSTVFWLLFSMGFAYYVDKIGRYSSLYGSIGAIIAFLVWMNASFIALLMGGVLNRILWQAKV